MSSGREESERNVKRKEKRAEETGDTTAKKYRRQKH